MGNTAPSAFASVWKRSTEEPAAVWARVQRISPLSTILEARELVRNFTQGGRLRQLTFLPILLHTAAACEYSGAWEGRPKTIALHTNKTLPNPLSKPVSVTLPSKTSVIYRTTHCCLLPAAYCWRCRSLRTAGISNSRSIGTPASI